MSALAQAQVQVQAHLPTFGSNISKMTAWLFWSIVNVGFLATSIAFIFFPTESGKMLMPLKSRWTSATWDCEWDSCHADIISSKLLVSAIGILFLFATGGFNQCLSDTLTLTNQTAKRFIFGLTTIYYMLASIGMLYLVSYGGGANVLLATHAQTTTVQILVSFFIAALSLGLLGTMFACCSSFVELLPAQTVMQQQNVETSRVPSSRAAMVGV